jgi:hypothetical protein
VTHDSPYFRDLGHWQIAGASGSKPDYGGKTVTANAFHVSAVRLGWFEQSVYFDPKHDGAVSGRKCRSLSSLQSAYDTGERLFHFVPTSADGVDECESVYEDFIGKLPGRTLVFWDEADGYGDTPALKRAVKRGGNEYQTKSVCISQRPTDMSTDIRSQLLTFVWVGPATQDLRAYCNQDPVARGISGDGDQTVTYYDVVKGRHEQPYMWTVFDSDSADTYDPVPKGYARQS